MKKLILFMVLVLLSTNLSAELKVVGGKEAGNSGNIKCANNPNNGNTDYLTIQAAIDDSNNDDEIVICDGTYNEAVTVNKTLTLRSQSGNRDNVIIQNGSTHTVTITNWINSVTIKNLTINQTASNHYGIYVTSEYPTNFSTFENISVTSQTWDAINFQGASSRVTIRDSFLKVSSNADGVDFGGEHNNAPFVLENSTIEAADNGIEINGANFNQGVTISNSTIEAPNGRAVDIRGNIWNQPFNISNSTISGVGGIYVQNSIGSGLRIANSTISTTGTGAGNNGIYISGEVNNGTTVSDTSIDSQRYGAYFGANLNGDVRFSDVNITSVENSLHFHQDLNQKATIEDSIIVSSENQGIVFNGHVYGGTEISNTRVTAEDDALEFRNKHQTTPVIQGSYFKSTNANAVSASIANYNDISASNNCFISEATNGYGFDLDLYGNREDVSISNNCFYASDTSHLAIATESAWYNNPRTYLFAGNYWDGVSGNYDDNNVVDNSPLGSCPNSCNYNPLPVYGENNVKEFSLLSQVNINGDMKVIGNTIMVQNNGNCPANNARNNNINTGYANVDPDGGNNFNSSSAELKLPNGYDIKEAYLYWQGYLATPNHDMGKVRFKTPSSSYTDVLAEDSRLNWVWFANNRFQYQGARDVTEEVKAAGEGKYFVANIQTQTGKPTGGSFGGWALVVVYGDDNATFKNISIYDGYQAISSSDASKPDVYTEKSIPLSGFLTPTNGDVNSKFLMFAGEGDVGATGDTVTLDDKDGNPHFLHGTNFNPQNDIMDSSITDNDQLVTDRDPDCQNTIGIDIDTFDVGNTIGALGIIGNDQSSTEATFASSGDGYFPGMMAFSTELYVPDVCFYEKITKDGEAVEELRIGDILDINVTITNLNPEPAKGLTIKKEFDNKLVYNPDSMKMWVTESNCINTDNDLTDANDSDCGVYSSDNNGSIELFLGLNAGNPNGGTVYQDTNETFSYQMEVNASGTIINEYKVSYKDESVAGGDEFNNVPISMCTDRSRYGTSLDVEASGNVKIVEPGIDCNFVQPRIYTKLAGKPFDLTLCFVDDDGTALGNRDIEFVRLIDKRDSDNEIWSATDLVTDSNGQIHYTIDLEDSTYKELEFRMSAEGNPSNSNNFAVRPVGFGFLSTTPDINGTTLRAGESNSGSFDIASYNYDKDSAATRYTKNILANNIDHNVSIEGASLGDMDLNFAGIGRELEFENGINQRDINVSFSNVGKYTVSLYLLDNAWTSVDQGSGDCNEDPNCLTDFGNDGVDGNGVYCCSFGGSTELEFTVVPYKLKLKLDGNISKNDYGDVDFAYFGQGVGKDINESYLELKFDIETQNKQNETTTNYDNKYFAESNASLDTNLTFNLEREMDLALEYWAVDRNGTTTLDRNSKTSPDGFFEIKIPDVDADTFENGESKDNSLRFRIDVKPKESQGRKEPENPYKIKSDGSNIEANSTSLLKTINLTDSGNLKDIDLKINGSDFIYYFGRLTPIDAQTTGDDVNVTFYIDVYCDSNCSSYDLTSKSVKYPASWYINTHENDLNISSGIKVNNDAIDDTKIPNINFSSNGKTTATFYKNKSPEFYGKAKVDIDLNASNKTFIYYNPYSDTNITRFYIDFMKAPEDVDIDDVIDNQGKDSESGRRLRW